MSDAERLEKESMALAAKMKWAAGSATVAFAFADVGGAAFADVGGAAWYPFVHVRVDERRKRTTKGARKLDRCRLR